MSYYPLATDSWNECEFAAIQRVVDSGRFTMGPEVSAFETSAAAYFGSSHAVMVNSGSSANLLAMASLAHHPDSLVQPGDNVIVPTVSWGTTYFPIHQSGLECRFVDIDRQTLNIDPTLVESAINDQTRAIMAVNLLGNPCDFQKLRDLCKKHNLLLIEDNCESMGATWKDQFTGTLGLCGTFSTFFSHHISTMEGGFVLTDDQSLYHTMLSMRAHGWTREQPKGSHLALKDDPFTNQFRFVLPGYNLRPLEISGAIGQEQLEKLPNLIEKRRLNAKTFRDVFESCDDVTIQTESENSSWFGFSMLLQNRLAQRRPEVIKALRDAEIDCRPIVAGNMLNNPVMTHLSHSVGSTTHVAEDVDTHGLFVGNHHYPIPDQIQHCRDIIDRVANG